MRPRPVNGEAAACHAHAHDRLLHHRGQAAPIDIVHREDLDARGAQLLALGRVEVAKLIGFLASDDAAYFVGETLNVNGGHRRAA